MHQPYGTHSKSLDSMGASIEVAKYTERLVPSTRIVSPTPPFGTVPPLGVMGTGLLLETGLILVIEPLYILLRFREIIR